MRSTTRFLDIEGAIRSGKTTVGVWKAILLAQENPGINGLLCRWTGDALDAQLKPRFWELCPKEMLDPIRPWHSDEEYVQFANGSRVYLRALKSSDEGARFSKTAGLTLAFILIDQPEEVPVDVYEYLKGRLSQPGFPQQLILLPNPPDLDHWICKEFPESNNRYGYEYIHLSTYDNAVNLGAEYIKSLEEAYPENHPMRRRLLLGLRGATARGVPVYGRIFKHAIHVKEIVPLETQPILESWDFAFHHPAVSWSQITPWGAWHVLGGIMGKDQYLEDFIPQARAELARFIRPGQEIRTTCDPSGESPTSHGSRQTAVAVLQENGIFPTVNHRANRPEVRAYAIEHIARLLLRLTPEGPAFVVHPRCATIIDGMATGYVYPDRLIRGIRVPLKDGYYDNLQNTLEYAVLVYLIPDSSGTRAVTPQLTEAESEDERDARRAKQRVRGRAGY